MLQSRKHILLVSLVVICEFFVVSQLQAEQKSKVFSAVFTTAVAERSPVDQVLILTNKTDKIFFHTDLRHFEQQKIIHRWEYNGKAVSSKTFDVKGPRWRVYSSKTLLPDQLGTWRVVVTTDKDWPLKAVIFKYVDSETEQDAILSLDK